MGRIEALAERYGRYIASPWRGEAERVVMVVYDKELERALRARKHAFEAVTRQAGHDWQEVDLAGAFARWVAADEDRNACFAVPEELHHKLEAGYPEHVAGLLRGALTGRALADDSVVAVFGIGALFGLADAGQLLKAVRGDIRGRLVTFLPGQYQGGRYLLLDAREGWSIPSVTITLGGEEGGIPG